MRINIAGQICVNDYKDTLLGPADIRTTEVYLRVDASQKLEAMVLLVDRAGWHMTPKLTVPPNISIIPLPAKSPELNPQENVWQFMRENWLSNRIFTSYAGIVDHCCYAWNRLVEEPWRIMSLGMRKWAHGS